MITMIVKTTSFEKYKASHLDSLENYIENRPSQDSEIIYVNFRVDATSVNLSMRDKRILEEELRFRSACNEPYGKNGFHMPSIHLGLGNILSYFPHKKPSYRALCEAASHC